eukprot:TRINITY_DN20393_c1_g2_i2.p1 TRINITY_DN20393_c1_g2~~TRINITY_DN20393_c1_g2_i2.p1  ORF type:complete len:961 (-),score=127.55 TRINITY_DN20393_c1_g2_i2:162-3044(-)
MLIITQSSIALALDMVKSSEAMGRLETLCQVPLQDIDRSCDEISRCKRAGHVGVQIGNHLGAQDLDDDALVAFLKHCAAEDFPVLIHPWEMSPVGPGNRTKDFMMGWTVGMPMETHLSITRMILGGAFDRLPETLRVCFAHGGGAFPALLGRLDNAWRERSIARGKAERPPREYMGRFYLDSAVFDANVLKLLVQIVGSEKVMLGSDYPFPLGEQEVGNLVRTAPGLSESQRDAILFKNAENFFRLPELEINVQSRPKIKMPSRATDHSRAQQWQSMRGFSTSSAAAVAQTSISASPSGERRVGNIVKGVFRWTGEGMPLINPATGCVDGMVATSSKEDVLEAVEVAKQAVAIGSEWRQMSLEARCAALSRLANLMEERLNEFAHAESRDTGKPLALAATLDIPRSIANLRFFSSLPLHSGGDVRSVSGPMQSMSYSVRKPVGVVGMVTPWNLPLYLFTWKLGPALAMGNSVVAKPSELTPTTATMLAELCAQAGIPQGVVNIVHGEGHVAGQALVGHPDVAAVSFTGGTATGASVAAIAAPQFKKLSLELGGKNAALVFDDCSFEDTVAGVVRSSFLNSGQICLCSSRILVQRGENGDFYRRFVNALVDAAKNLKVGSPDDPGVDLGPVVSEAHLSKIQGAISRAREEGGEVLCGGGRPEGVSSSGGYYIEPVIIAGLGADSSIFQTEVFGPVVTVHPFDTEEEAVELANSTRYGLSASLWSESLRRSELAEQLSAGTVWVNTWLNRELHMPFGGVRDSGVNREGGEHSLDFYSEASTVCVKRGRRAPLPMPGRGMSPSSSSTSSSNSTSRSFSSSAKAGMVEGAPSPLGAYVHARHAGGLIFLSGIGPRDPATNSVPGGPVQDPATGQVRDYDVEAQTRQCFANIKQILDGVGCELSDVVDVQAYLINMKRDFPAFNKVWQEEMQDVGACRTTIEIADLPPGGRIAVEMKVIAQPRGK